jgi:hypothetical protein
MSGTRTTKDSSVFKQCRFASSPVFDRSLKANLVAARCSILESDEQREAVWFVQCLSMHAGGLRWAASEIAPEFLTGDAREKWLATLCLDPATNSELEIVLPKLRQLMADYIQQRGEDVAVTAIGRLIYDALDYCFASRCLVLISGLPRLGKTWAAKKWVERNPGRARYCEVPASGDELSFYIALARALGVTLESDPKVKKLRPRIENALQQGGRTLVLDEAAALWPSSNYRQVSRPQRVSWVMSQINAGSSIALLVTPNFFASQNDYQEKSRWQSAQFYGRIEKYVSLPDTLPISDLEAVARAWLPHGDRRSIETLAHYSNLSQAGLAAIEHAVKQAIYLAKQDGRERPDWADIQIVMKSGVMPGDTSLAAAIASAGAHRKAPANGSRR